MKTVRQLVIALAWGGPLALLGQVPQGFSYQAVARNASGDPLAAQAVGVQFVLHQGNAFGAVVFAETHAATTNVHGLFSLAVGGGAATAGTFATIDWSAGPYFLEVGLDVGNNGSYVSTGTQQLMSVPYALYAGRSNVPDGTEVGQILHWTGTQWAADSGLYVHAKRFGIGVPQPDAPLGLRSRDQRYMKFQNGDIPAGQDFVIGSAGNTGLNIEQDTVGGYASRFFIRASDGHIGVGTNEPEAAFSIRTREILKAKFLSGPVPTPEDVGFTLDSTGFGIVQGLPGNMAGRFFIKSSNGNVGLGTTNPDAALTIRSTEPLKQHFQNGDIPDQDDFWNTIDSRGYGIGQGLSDSITLHVVVQGSTGHLGIGTDSPPAPLSIESRDILKTYFQTGDIPTQDDFAFTADSAGFGIDQGTPTTLASRLFIQASTGHVGIGSTAPEERLAVQGAADGGVTAIKVTNTATAVNVGWKMGHIHDAGPARDGAFAIWEDVTTSGSDSDMNDMVIRHDGNMGIGTATPGERLHVNGAVVLGNTDNSAPVNGTIRFNGTDLQGFTSGSWSSLGSNWEKVDNTDGVSLLSPSNARVGINEPLPQTTLHVQRPASDPDNGTQLDAGSGIATFGDLIDSSINLSDDGIQVRVPAPPGSSHPLAPGSLHLQRLGGDVLFHGDAATASEKVIIRSGGNVGIGELVPDASLHVRGREQCDDGNMVVRVDNPTTTTSTASSATRVGLQVTNTGVWSSNGEAKNIGLLVSSSGQANANANLAAVLNGNVVVGGLSTGPSVGTGGTNVLAIQNGAPPASPPAGTVQLFVTTASDGTSVLNIMDGNGGVMQLHVQNPLSAPDNNTVNPLYDAGTAAVITNMRTRINELEARLQAMGLLAP